MNFAREYTMFDPLDFELTSLHIPQFSSELREGQSVWCISPLTRRPVMETFHEVWLDTNILSQSTPNPNIAALMQMVRREKMGVSVLLALAELHRRHGPIEANELMLDKVPRFERFYGILFNIYEVTKQSQTIPLHSKIDSEYVKQLADTLLLIKYFYKKSGLDFESRLRGFAKVVRANLPPFFITFYVACIYFLVKERAELFGGSIKKKVDSDMAIYEDPTRNHTKAMNLASDLAMITQASAYCITRPPTRFRIPYIATSDRGFALLLREIAYVRLKINRQTKVGSGTPGFRPGGIMFAHCPPCARDIMKEYLPAVLVDHARLIPLNQFAENIAAGTFDHKKV